MYIPSFLPCPRCNSGPCIENIMYGYRLMCKCRFCKILYINDQQIEKINIGWNQLVREKPFVEQRRVDLRLIKSS